MLVEDLNEEIDLGGIDDDEEPNELKEQLPNGHNP